TSTNVNDFTSSGEIKDGMLYTTTSEGKIYAIHTEDGYVYWEKFIGEKPTKPTIGDDLLFIGYSGGLKVLDLNGKLIWEKDLSNRIISDPVVAGNTVIFGNDVGKVYALSVVYDTKEWSFSFNDEVYISSDYDDNIYIASGNNCYAINLEDEKIVWEFNTDGMITSPPVFKNNKVFVVSWDNNIYALDAENGKKLWYFETGWGIDTSPAVSENMVYVGSADNNLYALNEEDGSLKWIFTSNASIHSTPIAFGEYVFFGSDDGRFYALNKTTGDSVWFFAPGQTIVDLKSYITTPIISDSIVHNSTVFLGAFGTIYALDAQTIEQPASIGKECKSFVPEETWLFIVLSLVFLILITALYLGLSKKRVK
ncbi:MAG: PQQ-binding-like beta-propeller repeat protein, partial [Thermoplasmatales archaeon]|nr:PQQ-binding-like beta-propeller repeat protein [Thermoplasmatales archaeon]